MSDSYKMTVNFKKRTKGYPLKHERVCNTRQYFILISRQYVYKKLLENINSSEYLHQKVRPKLKFTQCLARIIYDSTLFPISEFGNFSLHPHARLQLPFLWQILWFCDRKSSEKWADGQSRRRTQQCGIEDPNCFGYEYRGMKAKNLQCGYSVTTYIIPTRTHI